MAKNARKFADLLTQAVYRIRSLEAKTLSAIQDELGFAIGRNSGGEYIQYLRKYPGNTPAHVADLEALVKEIARRTDFDRDWLEEFLQSADYRDAHRFCNQLRPDTKQNGYSLRREAPATSDDYVVEKGAIELSALEQGLDTFVVGRPIIDPRQFFGHEHAIRRIMGLWTQRPLQHVAVVGHRGSGKTSLAYNLINLAKAQPTFLRQGQRSDWLPNPDRYRWLYVNFQDPRMRRTEWLFRYILSQLGLPAPESCDLSTFIDLVMEGQKTPTIILMDEIEAALSASELDMEFWWGMRSLGTDSKGMLAFLITAHGLPEQQALDVGKPSPFFNIFHTMHLGPLRECEARELVGSSPTAFAPPDVEWILGQSGLWPALLQILCHTRQVTLEEEQDGESWKEEALHQIAAHSHLLNTR